MKYEFGTNNFSGGSQTPSSAPSSNIVSSVGNSFSVTVPAYTMVVLTIPFAAPANTPPLLTAISNFTVNVGQFVAFTASATDTDAPPQALTFTLLTGPTNATLNTNSGAFSYRPLVTQSNSTNLFTLKVADNGTPSLSAMQSFNVFVNPLASSTIAAAMVSGGVLLTFNGTVGPDYAVQASTNLTQWSTLYTTNSPSLPFIWTDTNKSSFPARFYRLQAGPPLP